MYPPPVGKTWARAKLDFLCIKAENVLGRVRFRGTPTSIQFGGEDGLVDYIAHCFPSSSQEANSQSRLAQPSCCSSHIDPRNSIEPGRLTGRCFSKRGGPAPKWIAPAINIDQSSAYRLQLGSRMQSVSSRQPPPWLALRRSPAPSPGITGACSNAELLAKRADFLSKSSP